jgi:hypothetical protein
MGRRAEELLVIDGEVRAGGEADRCPPPRERNGGASSAGISSFFISFSFARSASVASPMSPQTMVLSKSKTAACPFPRRTR